MKHIEEKIQKIDAELAQREAANHEISKIRNEEYAALKFTVKDMLVEKGILQDTDVVDIDLRNYGDGFNSTTYRFGDGNFIIECNEVGITRISTSSYGVSLDRGEKALKNDDVQKVADYAAMVARILAAFQGFDNTAVLEVANGWSFTDYPTYLHSQHDLNCMKKDLEQQLHLASLRSSTTNEFEMLVVNPSRYRRNNWEPVTFVKETLKTIVVDHYGSNKVIKKEEAHYMLRNKAVAAN